MKLLTSRPIVRPPGSLQRRLILGAAVGTAVALVGASLSIGVVLHRFVRGQLDGRLDERIISLVSEVREDPEGDLSLRRNREVPPFDHLRSGWYWEVRRGDAVLGSASLGGAQLGMPDVPVRPAEADRPIPADGVGPYGDRLILRVLTVPGRPGVPATVFVASAPAAALYRPVLEVLRSVGICMALIGVFLVAGVLVQVRVGLRPLRRLLEQLGEVRAGLRERVPADQPVEVRPLVGEINALLDQNAANLTHARGHVANLAHGLKTPLATLAMAFGEAGSSRDARLAGLVDGMDRRIRHHLRRARAAATGGTTRERVDLSGVVGDLVMVLGRVNAEKAISFGTDVPAGLAVACDREDVEEILGNLIENACRWCSGRVRVSAARENSSVVVLVEDDGPGLEPGDREAVLQRGRRLDESEPGHGFGLPIAQELAELYGGALELEASRLGGLAVRLSLPS
ncbi:sensor histidine kinase [Methylobacterium sp. SyP6R]|uniref:sensor histidine kinase n=1 Tax=Methylobacterium sp. SyP6R TaxID=2718876 RepID=UPI001F292619|nr:HAMP domain-containing sensor histidine kinase [Methylobacterium sp. SyP6R]MCF4130052.1 HAMP domain-containing histidine kinase [Methylobacterium sp. SyP6R]